MLLFCSQCLFALRQDSTDRLKLSTLSSHLRHQGPDPAYPRKSHSRGMQDWVPEFPRMPAQVSHLEFLRYKLTLQCGPKAWITNQLIVDLFWDCTRIGLRLQCGPGSGTANHLIGMSLTLQCCPEIGINNQLTGDPSSRTTQELVQDSRYECLPTGKPWVFLLVEEHSGIPWVHISTNRETQGFPVCRDVSQDLG